MTHSVTMTALQKLLDETPMAKFMGIKGVSWDEGQSTLVCTMPMRRELSNSSDARYIHGGAIAAFIDTVATFTVMATGILECATANIRIDFLRPAVDTNLQCISRTRRLGKTTAVVDSDVFDDAGTLLAIGRCGVAIVAKQ